MKKHKCGLCGAAINGNPMRAMHENAVVTLCGNCHANLLRKNAMKGGCVDGHRKTAANM